MTFTGFFIQRPVFTYLMAFTLFLAGVITCTLIPISALPKLDFPGIQITANLPGATPEVMGRVVALPLERQLTTIAGVKSIVSSSSTGTTVINMEFELDRNIDAAAQDVGTAISAAQKTLPQNLPSPPTYKKLNPSDQPVLYFAVQSTDMPLSKLNDYAQTLSDRLSVLTGVSQVELNGPQQYAVRIYLDPLLMAARGLSWTDVSNAVQNANVNTPLGQLNGSSKTQILKADNELLTAKSYNEIVVSQQRENSLKLKDIGSAQDGVVNDLTAAWFNGERCILLAVRRQADANTIEVVNEALKTVQQVTQHNPSSLKVSLVLDRSQSVRESVKDVIFTFLLSIGLVVGVIYLFLQNIKATLIPAMTLPLSLMTTFVLMYYCGYSFDNLSLLALTLAIGFIVDDAIVVMENITHHIERGQDPYQAALKGSSEITFTVMSMTFSLIAVFIPIICLQGIVGRLFREFGMTLTIVILMSGFVALTISPVMCRSLLSAQPQTLLAQTQKRSGLFQRYFEKSKEQYGRSLHWVMHRPKLLLSSLGLILALSVGLFIVIPKGFFPNEDTGIIYGVTEANPDVSFEFMKKAHYQVMDILKAHPSVDVFNTSIGASTTTQALNNGRFFVLLKPRAQRSQSITQVMDELREQLADISSLKIFMQPIQNLRVGGSLGKSQYVYTLQSPNIDELYKTSATLQEEISKISGVRDVGSDAAINALQVKIHIDRDRASTLGVSVSEISNALNLAFGTAQVSLIYGTLDTYEVILNTAARERMTLRDLYKIQVKNQKGQMIRLDRLVDFAYEPAALTVNHYNQLPAVTLSYNLAPGVALGDVVTQIRHLEDTYFQGKEMRSSFQGAAQAFEESTRGEGWILGGAILAIYIVLGMLYESYIHPLTILSGIPTASVGALLALYLMGRELDTVSFIGIILLIGIMKKNAIMMVDFALQYQQEGHTNPSEAIFEAALRRFRPIMMTTFAALAGSLPIALGIGASAELRQPMGIAIVGGLLISQLLTLYSTPVIFVYMSRFTRSSY